MDFQVCLLLKFIPKSLIGDSFFLCELLPCSIISVFPCLRVLLSIEISDSLSVLSVQSVVWCACPVMFLQWGRPRSLLSLIYSMMVATGIPGQMPGNGLCGNSSNAPVLRQRLRLFPFVPMILTCLSIHSFICPAIRNSHLSVKKRLVT